MSENKKIWYATTSKLKFQEAFDFCSGKGLGVELLQEETEMFEIQTRDPKDVQAVALHKGKQAWDRVGNPVLVEYSGLFLNKYGSFPGSLTKHVFKGIGYRGLFRLVDSGDSAVFVSYLTYVDEYGNSNLFEGRQEGYIVKPEKLEINSEFPFDQIFVPSVSEAGVTGSYRTMALAQLIQYLKKTSH